ncbi:hypothetical protein TNCV_1070301 [Trichonephila clavipes]|nr:hypothetical protein TNCV_1070301 [Trichonephila clavipes]
MVLVAGRHWEMEREAFLHPISNIVQCGLMWKGLDGDAFDNTFNITAFRFNAIDQALAAYATHARSNTWYNSQWHSTSSMAR